LCCRNIVGRLVYLDQRSAGTYKYSTPRTENSITTSTYAWPTDCTVVFTILYNIVIRYLNIKYSDRETTQRYYNQRISLLLGYISFLIRTLQMVLDSSNISDLTTWNMGVQICEICPFLWYNIFDEIYDKIFKYVWESC